MDNPVSKALYTFSERKNGRDLHRGAKMSAPYQIPDNVSDKRDKQ